VLAVHTPGHCDAAHGHDQRRAGEFARICALPLATSDPAEDSIGNNVYYIVVLTQAHNTVIVTQSSAPHTTSAKTTPTPLWFCTYDSDLEPRQRFAAMQVRLCAVQTQQFARHRLSLTRPLTAVWRAEQRHYWQQAQGEGGCWRR
jgi:hypothetical protein